MLENITKKFVAKSQEILLDNLVGIYLHGSAVMGCFNDFCQVWKIVSYVMRKRVILIY